jgi:hypothetical protein
MCGAPEYVLAMAAPLTIITGKSDGLDHGRGERVRCVRREKAAPRTISSRMVLFWRVM